MTTKYSSQKPSFLYIAARSACYLSGSPRLCICVFFTLHYMHYTYSGVSIAYWVKVLLAMSVRQCKPLWPSGPIEDQFQGTESLNKVVCAGPNDEMGRQPRCAKEINSSEEDMWTTVLALYQPYCHQARSTRFHPRPHVPNGARKSLVSVLAIVLSLCLHMVPVLLFERSRSSEGRKYALRKVQQQASIVTDCSLRRPFFKYRHGERKWTWQLEGFAFAAPSVDGTLISRAPHAPYHDPFLAIPTDIYVEDTKYTAVMSKLL